MKMKMKIKSTVNDLDTPVAKYKLSVSIQNRIDMSEVSSTKCLSYIH